MIERPLSISWREWIAPRPHAAGPPDDGNFDAIVVGSGYGGSVAALRLAEKGHRVVLLERGGEYLPGDFPDDFAHLPKHVRANVPGRSLPVGRASGLYEFTIGQGMAAVTGNGLGGGSLINAGVVIRPDADVFAQDAWPAEIRHGPGLGDPRGELEQAFLLAGEVLGSHTFKPSSPWPKTTALQDAAHRLGKQCPAPVKHTQDPRHCTQCGDCASGCNEPGAKGDLRSTYLRRAFDTGRVQIVSHAEVYRFTRPDPANAQRWQLWVHATDAQHQKVSRQEAAHDDGDPASTLRHLYTPLLVICAGTVGSTQLLQRSQALAGQALCFSPALGTRVSGNGDSLSVLREAHHRVQAVGHGADRKLQAMDPQEPAHHAHTVGPTITAMLDLRDKSRPLTERLLLQDGAIPGALRRAFAELLATSQTLAQLERWSFAAAPKQGHSGARNDPLGASIEASQRTQVWLAMGHDGSPGHMVWQPGTDSSALVMPDPGALPTYQAQQKLFDRLQGSGLHLHSPLWQALPPSASATMSGAVPPRWLTTVHPLGGCPMGDGPASGVVNHQGQVWMHAPSLQAQTTQRPASTERPGAPSIYEGLYVLDGSIVPTSLGCNPLLTITALAERAMALLPKRPAQPAPAVRRSPPRPRVHTHQPRAAHNVVLSETLRASRPARGRWAQTHPGLRLDVRLDAELASEDMETTLAQAQHAFQVHSAQLHLGWHTTQAHSDAAPEPPLHHRAYLRAPGGDNAAWFHFLPASTTGSHGLWPAIATCTEVALWFALGLGGPVAAVVALCLLGWAAGWLPALGALALGALAFLIWGVLMIGPRTILTWLALRGGGELRGSGPEQWRRGLRAMVHAREKRTMKYHVPMRRDPDSGPATPDFPEEVLLSAHKRVTYRASVPQLLRWSWRQLRRRLGLRAEIPALRPSYWEQLMDAQVTITATAPPGSEPACLLACEMKMGFDSLFSPRAAQLGSKGDTTTGLLMLGGYALLAARFALKTRLYDFRLPNYSQRPAADQASFDDTALRRNSNSNKDKDKNIHPELHTVRVCRGVSSGDLGDEAMSRITLRLQRYRPQDANRQALRPTFEPARHGTLPVRRVRSVLLLHAFGQSGLTYTHKIPEPAHRNLAEAFLDQGYEVWLLDSRMSTRSGQAERPSNVDMQALYDVPRAIQFIHRQLARELGEGPPLQTAAFGQCIGSAALWMALLDGRLARTVATPAGRVALPRLWGAMFSQVHALTRGTPTTRAKTWLPAQLQHLMAFVPFGVRGPQSGLWQGLDRLLASMPAPEAERARSANEDGVATCRRIRFIEAPLFRHENLHPETVAQMNRLFGAANLRLFAHARRFVEHERLVDEDGFNRYVTDDRLRTHLNLPVQLLHGRENELFDVRGAHDTFRWLKKSHPACVALAQAPLVMEGYGHLDVLLGQRAHREVFPGVLRFFDAALVDDTRSWDPPPGPEVWRVRAPRVGPMLGWVRQAGGTPAVRLAFVIDDLHGGSVTDDADTQVVVRLRHATKGHFFEIAIRPVIHAVYRPSEAAPQPPAYRVAWVDVHPTLEHWLNAGAGEHDLVLQVMSLHRMRPGLATCAALPLAPAQRDELINAHLAAHALQTRRHNAAARFDGHPTRTPLADHMAASVPQAMWRSLALGAQPGATVEFLSGCCRHPGLTVDQARIDDGLLQALQQPLPAFALLVGDQIYADATAGLADPASPVERYVERHETAFTSPGMRRLLARVPTFMTPDDHEWIDNHPLASPLLKWRWPDWNHGSAFRRAEHQRFRWARDAIQSFQRIPVSRASHRYAAAGPFGPVRLFILDTRRNRRRGKPIVVLPGTLDRLQKWLHQGSADVLNVVVSGSVALPGLYLDADPASPGAIDTWQHAPEQRQALLDMLVQHSQEQGQRFMLLSGDYHVSAALLVQIGAQPVGAAVVVPPLYAPMPYANAAPEHLDLGEALQANDHPIRLRPVFNGEPRRGSGLARISVRHLGPGAFRIGITRDLRCFEAGTTGTPPEAQTAWLEL